MFSVLFISGHALGTAGRERRAADGLPSRPSIFVASCAKLIVPETKPASGVDELKSTHRNGCGC
jgi:hypothetical protein